MTISLSNNTVVSNAPLGTIVGTLSDTKGPASFIVLSLDFTVSGNKLITKWSKPINPGNYSILVLAYPFDGAFFTIEVTKPKPTIGINVTSGTFIPQPKPEKSGP